MFSVVGRGCVILECREEVRLGMTKLSTWSRVGGRSPVRGRRLSEGAMIVEVECSLTVEQLGSF